MLTLWVSGACSSGSADPARLAIQQHTEFCTGTIDNDVVHTPFYSDGKEGRLRALEPLQYFPAGCMQNQRETYYIMQYLIIRCLRYKDFSLFLLTDPGYQIMASKSWLPDPGFPILATRSWLPNPGCQILATRSWLADPG